jgi:phosphoribosylformylglycinamidine synthase
LEGDKLTEDDLSAIARDVFCNELIETWTVISEAELKNNNRFHQERVKRDLPKVLMRTSGAVDQSDLSALSDEELVALSRRKLWALSLAEMKAVRDYFASPEVKARRAEKGLGAPTDVELEVIAQSWSEHCKHKIFGATVHYTETSSDRHESDEPIPAVIDSLFKTTIAGTTRELTKPWLLSVFSDNAGIVAFDEEDAFCIKVETHNSPSALDPYGGALTGIVGVNRDILGCGLGAKPVFNTNVFCVAPLDYPVSAQNPLPDRLLHPRRILDGVRRGVEHGGNKSGIPTVNGALVFDDRYLGKPLVYCGTGGFMPRFVAGRACELKEIHAGDRVVMIGGRIGKDGIHGATFSSLAFDESSPSSAVQLGDPITQKRVGDFLLEARDLGLYRALTDNGAGGLSSSVGELAQLSGGAEIDVARAKVKYPGLKPYELVVSESQERMTLAVAPDRLAAFMELAARRSVEASDLGSFTNSGSFDILYNGARVASLELEFLHHGVPKLVLDAHWTGRGLSAITRGGNGKITEESYERKAESTLLKLMGRPNIASKEWLIRQYDHEVQGTSVIKPLHMVGVGTPEAGSGPNDGAVIKPKPGSDSGLVIGCGINPKLSDIDPYLMAQSVVDEAVRNVLCAGADFGRSDSVLALCDNFCWPDPVGDPLKMAWLVRACYGMRNAALALSAPLVSGKDSMKNDFRGKRRGEPVSISVPPTLLMTAVAKVSDIRSALTSDFKRVGDVIYLLGSESFGILGSELACLIKDPRAGEPLDIGPSDNQRVAEPDWILARKVYSWLGGAMGRERGKLRSLHDVSDGGVMVALSEGLLARGLGAEVTLPACQNPWEISFGEGFHCFIASVTEADSFNMESEWTALEVPFTRIGVVTAGDQLEVQVPVRGGAALRWKASVKNLRAAWLKSGFWE